LFFQIALFCKIVEFPRDNMKATLLKTIFSPLTRKHDMSII